MENQEQQNTPVQGQPQWTAPQPTTWKPAPPRRFPVEGKEHSFAIATVLCAMGAVNCLLWGGMNAGLAVFMMIYMGFATRYLMPTGENRASAYPLAVITLSMVVALSFLRNDDPGLKFLLFVLVVGAYPLGLCILAGKNRRDPGQVESVLDAFGTIFARGFGDGPVAFASVFRNRKEDGGKGKAWSVAKGLLIALPVLIVLLGLLREADEAFEQLLKMLPDINLAQIIVTVLAGLVLSLPLLGMGMSLAHGQKTDAKDYQYRGASPTTVNTVLISVVVVYVLYLISQMAYFANGFVGLLPSGYTAAQYARRGFFEMAVVCAINLGLIALCAYLVRKENGMPASTRGLCVFIAAVTLFLVGSAVSKMFLYIGVYGLTYLRVLTTLFMLWLALAVVLVAASLYKKVAYMKILVITALVIAAFVSWAGLDTLVAKYNVDAYLSGRLDSVDVDYLDDLDSAAVPYLAELLDCGDVFVETKAYNVLMDTARWGLENIRWNSSSHTWIHSSGDVRAWNLTEARAERVIWDLIERDVLNSNKSNNQWY